MRMRSAKLLKAAVLSAGLAASGLLTAQKLRKEESSKYGILSRFSVKAAECPDQRVDQLSGPDQKLSAPENSLIPKLFQKYKIANETVLLSDTYAVLFDNRLRIPTLVMEILDKSSFDGETQKRPRDFFTDQRVYEYFQVGHRDYTHSGYTRGHMAAASNHKTSRDNYLDTFLMTNITPQLAEGFNDGQGVWTRLEQYVAKLAKSPHTKRVIVFSGPLFIPQKIDPMDESSKRCVHYEVFSNHDVAVPTHFFKVVFIEQEDCGSDSGSGDGPKSGYEIEVYLMEHRKYANARDEDLQKFRVDLETVEWHSGHVFPISPVTSPGISRGVERFPKQISS